MISSELILVWLCIAQTRTVAKIALLHRVAFQERLQPTYRLLMLQQVNEKLFNVIQKATQYNKSIIDNFLNQKK